MSHHPEPEAQRRNFLVEAAAVLIGGVVTLAPLAAGVLFFLTPLRRRSSTSTGGAEGGSEFVKVGAASALVPDGPPTLFQVIGTKVDAWTTYPQTSLGAVYVRQRSDGGLLAFNARCTHLGCSVSYRPDQQKYVCPCHTSAFNLDGQRTNEIPPRNLDELEVKIVDNEVWVRFQNFRAGQEEKIPV